MEQMKQEIIAEVLSHIDVSANTKQAIINIEALQNAIDNLTKGEK